MQKGIVFFLFAIFLLQLAYAQEVNHIISNSEDWRDVYSTMLYANLQGIENDFLVSTGHSTVLLYGVNKQKRIQVISSEDRPFVFNYPSLIESRDFLNPEEIRVESANLELIEELPDINNFVVVSDSYGYNVIAVAPYAVVSDSWVFLANRVNIAEIDSILQNRDVDKVIIYGHVDREVRDTLEKYNPETINSGDKFRDNTEIVEKYLDIKDMNQVLLTNGEFIEKEIMSGNEPVLFTGRENVPDQIRDWLKESDIQVGVLVGNELVGAATNIRRSTGISVMVKFARGARAPSAGVSTVEGLDIFYLPSPSMNLLIHSARYNTVSSQLEITYKSESNIPVYLKGTITLFFDSDSQRLGDLDPVFIAPNDFKTVSYPVEVSGESLRAEIFTLYGETPGALDRILEANVNVSKVNVIDGCSIDILGVKYSKQRNQFVVKTKNTANIDCWIDIEFSDIMIDGLKQTIGTEGSTKISEKKTKNIILKQEMTEQDLEDNQFVNLVAYYGEKEDFLVKIFRGKFEINVVSLSLMTYVIIALAVIIIGLVIFFIILKRREEDDDEL
jgi:hypothetical protein